VPVNDILLGNIRVAEEVINDQKQGSATLAGLAMKMEPGVSREIPGEGDEIIHATRIGEIEVSQFLSYDKNVFRKGKVDEVKVLKFNNYYVINYILYIIYN
jgi:hypothetical protein